MTTNPESGFRSAREDDHTRSPQTIIRDHRTWVPPSGMPPQWTVHSGPLDDHYRSDPGHTTLCYTRSVTSDQPSLSADDFPNGPDNTTFRPRENQTLVPDWDPANLPICPQCQYRGTPHQVGTRGGYSDNTPEEVVMYCNEHPEAGWFPIPEDTTPEVKII